jgi:signal peptidase II
VSWLWLSLLVILLDQVSKLLAESSLPHAKAVAVTAFFNLTLVYNEGAAFSFLSDQGGWQRWFFVVLALVVSGVLVFWLRSLERGERLTAMALALVIGGALGNVIDRILYGHVIDFLDFHYGGWHWPAFNIADSAITLGVMLMLYDVFFPKRTE